LGEDILGTCRVNLVTGSLRLIVPVPEAQVGTMTKGRQVSFTVAAYPGQTFKAPIQRISGGSDSSHLDDARRTRRSNRDGKLVPGSFTTATSPFQRGYPTLFVPVSSVATDQQHTFVIRIQSNTAHWVTVQTGQTVAREIEVFGDRKAGDQVVKAASDAIHAGDKVQTQAH